MPAPERSFHRDPTTGAGRRIARARLRARVMTHRVATAVLLLVSATASTGAQTAADSIRRNRPLFVKTDLYILGMFSAAMIGMFPLDRRMASTLRDPRLVANRTLQDLSKGFRFFGAQGPYFIGAGMYVVGRVTGVRRAAALGLHGTEALLIGAGVSNVMKVVLGRERPYVSADTNPRNFGFMRGRKGRDYRSFPSGHSTAAFAAAAAVSTETAAWWPETRWIFGPILYGGATLVAVSRVYDDQHWASDVVMAAAVGTFAGLKTVRFNQTHEGNRIDRWLLGSEKEPPRLRLTVDRWNRLQIGTGFGW